jgi:hypothetical protein
MVVPSEMRSHLALLSASSEPSRFILQCYCIRSPMAMANG